ncbi:MAG: sugar phosphate isomerase/epimerase [Planctomycetota bacterium]
MKLGYNTNGFAFHRLEDALEIIADLGYTAVAITPDVHHLDPYRSSVRELERVASLVDRLGLEPVVETGARFVLDPRRKHRPTLLSPEHEERLARQRLLERCVEMAGHLGAGVMSLWSGTPEEPIDLKTGMERLKPGLDSVLDLAQRLSIQIGFEPEPGMWIESITGYSALCAALGRDDLGLTLDLGHLNVTEQPPYAPLVDRVASRVVNVHIDDARGGVHEHLLPGEGEMPLEELLRVLWDRGFAGVASVELSRHAHDAVNAARLARKYLRRLWPVD